MSSPAHDGLAGARVVGQQETKRLPRQHGFVHRGDLVRQRLDFRGVHGEQGVEEMREANPLCLGDQAEQGAVAVETPRPADLGQLEPLFVITIQKLIGDFAGGRLVGQLDRLGAEPLHVDNCHEAVGQNAANRSVGLHVFQFHIPLFFFSHSFRPGGTFAGHITSDELSLPRAVTPAEAGVEGFPGPRSLDSGVRRNDDSRIGRCIFIRNVNWDIGRLFTLYGHK